MRFRIAGKDAQTSIPRQEEVEEIDRGQRVDHQTGESPSSRLFRLKSLGLFQGGNNESDINDEQGKLDAR